jgi:hypothetical protein
MWSLLTLEEGAPALHSFPLTLPRSPDTTLREKGVLLFLRRMDTRLPAGTQPRGRLGYPTEAVEGGGLWFPPGLYHITYIKPVPYPLTQHTLTYSALSVRGTYALVKVCFF